MVSVEDNMSVRCDTQTQLPAALSLLGSSAARVRLFASLINRDEKDLADIFLIPYFNLQLFSRNN